MPKKKASRKPKIFITTDLEGASGVWRFEQTRDRTTALYTQAVEYMMGDIAACVRGLKAGGAGTIVVVDGHGGGDNFIPHLMAPGATYITGKPRPRGEGMDRSFDGAILLGYHAMKGTADGVLNHTQSSKIEARYWYNGVESGEIVQSALTVGSFGMPVIMVTGDKATCRETRRFLGKEVVTVATKRGIGRECAELYPFEETREAIFKGAQKAVAAISNCKPYKLRLPIKCKRQWIQQFDRPSETRVETREASIRDIMKITNF